MEQTRTPSSSILVVDDNRIVLRVLKDGLEAEGFVIYTASSGVEALEKVIEHKPNAILLDIIMPGITGYEVCKVLRGDPHTKSIPIIMVTASLPEEVQKEGRAAGADDLWAKPVNIHQIAGKLKSILHQGVEYEPIDDRVELRLLKGHLGKVAGDIRDSLQSLFSAVDLLTDAAEFDRNQIAELIRAQVERLRQSNGELHRLAS